MSDHGAVSAEPPVLIIGGGLSGLATAITCAVHGRASIVLEASELVGGAAAYSGGQVWVGANHVAEREGITGDSRELTELYVRDVASHLDPGALDDRALVRWIDTAPSAMEFFENADAVVWSVIGGLADYHSEARGARAKGRYLTNAPLDASVLGDWRDRLRYSPYFPVGIDYEEMLEKGRRAASLNESADDRRSAHAGLPALGLATGSDADMPRSATLTFGTGVVGSFLARAIQSPLIEIRTEHRVIELTREGDAIVGLRADTPDGTVRLDGPVVLATSTYDWDPSLVSEFLGIGEQDWGSVAPREVRGDGVRLARSVGGDVVAIAAGATPILPGWRLPGEVEAYGYGPEYALPHSMIVGRSGERYCNDSYWVDICRRTLEDPERRMPFFLIWDDDHRQKYGLDSTPPGGEYPDGFVESADTLQELGVKLGIDGEQLAATARRFSSFAEDGVDPDWGRGSIPFVNKLAGDPQHAPSPVLGTIAKPPFHGKRLRFVGTGIGTSGVRIDGDGHVLDVDGAPICGLYAAGSVAALTTTGTAYNSGFALGRGLTLAYLVGHELAGAPIG